MNIYASFVGADDLGVLKITSNHLDDKTQLRMGGGDAFAYVTAAEATTIANAWLDIAEQLSKYADRLTPVSEVTS